MKKKNKLQEIGQQISRYNVTRKLLHKHKKKSNEILIGGNLKKKSKKVNMTHI